MSESSVWSFAPPAEVASGRAKRAVAALFFLNGLLTATWVARIPAFQSIHSLGHGQLGLLLLGLALGAVVAMPLTGAWIARRGSREPTRLTAWAFCLVLVGIALAPTRATFAALLCLTGLVHGALDVAMNAQAIEVERRAGRPIMSSMHALFSAGGLVGAASGAAFAAAGVAPTGHFVGIAAVLLCLASWANAQLPAEGATTIVARTQAEPGSAQAGGRRGPLLALGLLAFCTMVAEGAMADWSALFLREVRHASEGLAALGYAAFSVAMLAGRWAGDDLLVRFGPVRLLRWGGTVATVGLLWALLLPDAGAGLLGFAAVGLGLATLVPMIFSAAGRMPGFPRGVALSAVTTSGYLGFLIGPPAIGFVAEAIGLRGGLGLLVGTSILLALGAPALRSGDERLSRRGP